MVWKAWEGHLSHFLWERSVLCSGLEWPVLADLKSVAFFRKRAGRASGGSCQSLKQEAGSLKGSLLGPNRQVWICAKMKEKPGTQLLA